MRLIFQGDRIIGGNSAYSKLGREICTRLAKSGHQIAHTPIGRTNKMGKQSYEGVLIYPSGEDYFAEDVALSNYTDFKADMLIAIKDTWVWNHIFRLGLNFVPFAVIDHSPVSASITSRLETAFKVIAISRFGQIELRRKKIDSVYIPHAVRCDIYKPLTPEQKAESRKLFGLPQDAFVVGCVAMNRARKMIPRMLRGFKRFRDLNPDINAHMMLWTNIQPRRPADDVTLGVSDVGVNLIPEIIELGLNEVVHWPSWEDVEKIGGLPEHDPTGNWDMTKLYGTFDVNYLCLPPYERVWTNSKATIAKKRIAHIREGDHVLTDKGKFQKVTKVMKRDYSGKLLKISSLYGYNVTLTPRHPILIRRKSEKQPRWIPASDVKQGDMVTIPKPQAHYRKKALVVSRSLTKMRKELPTFLNFNPLLFRFFGYYVAEGNSIPDKGTVQFALHAKNDEEIVTDLKAIANVWGMTAKESIISTNKMKVMIYSRRLAGILRHHFGSNSHKKRLPAWMLRLTDERGVLIPSLLKALWKGDGWVGKTKAEYTTVSRQLAEQVCFLLLRNGILPCQSYDRLRKAYRIRIFGKQMKHFGNLINAKTGEPQQKRSQFRKSASLYFLPVKKIESFDYVGKVHNLQVEGDESYATPLIVHNCSGGEGAGLTYLESAACGVVSVGTNYAGGPEYIGPGLTVPWHDYIIFNTPGVRYVLADIDGMAEALRKVYDGDRGKMAVKCRKFAEGYDWNLVMERYWKPFLEGCAEELYPLVSRGGLRSWA